MTLRRLLFCRASGRLELYMQYLIMCRSLTVAQRAAALLERKGINASVVKAPKGLSTKGCGYAIIIYRRFDEALMLLRQNNLLTGKVFVRKADGEYTEV